MTLSGLGFAARVRWRTGWSAGRTIYAMSGAEPSDRDRLIGMMDTPELAAAACFAHNEVLDRPAARLP